MSVGWRQFNSVASNFRQAGFAYTTNGGTRWIAPGVLENNVFRSDPVLNFDTVGRFFYLSLVQNFFDDLWRSITGGQSWTRIGPADGGDKQWFTIDNTNSSGHGFQYQCWSTDGNNYGGRQFTRSTDGGLTWMNPINIPNSPAWGTLDVDSTGNLFIGGVNLTTGRIWCVRSINAKNGGVVPTFDQSTAVNLGGDIVFASRSIRKVSGSGFSRRRSFGHEYERQRLHARKCSASGFTNGSDVMFVRSTNGGTTFSAPRRINDDPVNHAKWHWFGTLSVAPNGRIDVVWFDTRNAPNNANSQLFIRTASMAETPGRRMSRSAIRLTRLSVIRIRTSSAITLQSFPITPAPTCICSDIQCRGRRLLCPHPSSSGKFWATSALAHLFRPVKT